MRVHHSEVRGARSRRHLSAAPPPPATAGKFFLVQASWLSLLEQSARCQATCLATLGPSAASHRPACLPAIPQPVPPLKLLCSALLCSALLVSVPTVPQRVHQPASPPPHFHLPPPSLSPQFPSFGTILLPLDPIIRLYYSFPLASLIVFFGVYLVGGVRGCGAACAAFSGVGWGGASGQNGVMLFPDVM